MRFTSVALQILFVTSISAQSNFSDFEMTMMKAFDWCNGGGNPIHWIDKSKDVWQNKVRAGSRFAPQHNEEGKIDDLGEFVRDRLQTIPVAVGNEALPALIIEDHCASAEQSTQDCIFDFAGTPAPEQWALQDGIAGIFPSGVGTSIPAELSFWERKKQMTVVFVPASNTPENAEELTNNDPNKPKLASLKVRGNSSRKIPKKQFLLKLPNATELIPGGSKAKKWIVSAYPSDFTYVENAVVFESYRRLGVLQKQFGDWPSEGSTEDLATQAWSPRSLPVNLILQGRYVGLYSIVDKVDLEDRVWIPAFNNEMGTPPMIIDGITLPSGSYFLGYDFTERQKKALNPDRVISGEEDEFYFPNHPAGASALYNAFFGFDKLNAWTIDGPDDKSFADYENEEDIALLRSFLLKLDEWVEDPVGNDGLLSQVVDMRSLARYFLMAELAREADDYAGSMNFKYIKGKLYHAAPWDYAGTSYPTHPCGSNFRWSGIRVNWETGTYDEPEPCDDSTGGMHTAGWHVDSLFLSDWVICVVCDEGESVCPCDEGELVKTNLRWFLSQLFHTPSLQSEFWALWDIVVEHGLVESATSSTARSRDLGSGDLLSMNLLLDQLFEPQKVAAAVDRKIWYAQMGLIYLIAESNAAGVIPEVDNDVCTPILYESLRASAAGDTDTEPHLIPSKDWMFHTAAESGEFMQFYKNPDMLAFGFADIIDNNALIAKKKDFINRRINWIASQHPNTAIATNDETNGAMASSQNLLSIFVGMPDMPLRGTRAGHIVLFFVVIVAGMAVLLFMMFRIMHSRRRRSQYEPIKSIEMET